MADDEAALAAALDTPAEPEAEAPEETGTPSETPADINWQERYENQQAALTRAQQEAAELREYKQVYEHLSNEETQAEALQRYLNISLEEAEEIADELDDDPTHTLAQRLDQLESRLQADAEQAETMQRVNEQVEQTKSEMAELEDQHGKFTPDQWNAIIDLAVSRSNGGENVDVKAAFETLTSVTQPWHQKYLESKKSDAVAVGTAGSEKINMADDDAVTDLFANMIEAESQV